MNTVLRALWSKVNGVGLTNPSEATTLLRDLNNRLTSLEKRYEELANDRPEADRGTGEGLSSVDSGDSGRRTGSKAGSKDSPPRRGK